MLHELRIYTLKAGTAAAAAHNAATLGKEIRGDNYGKLEGYFTTDVGPLNRVVHFWSHPSYDARLKTRADLAKNPRWTSEYVPAIREKLLAQEVRLLNPVVGPVKPDNPGNFYELRFYQLKPGAAKSWLDLFQSKLPTREKYSKIVGLWHTESGQPNEVVHLWSYPDLKTRAHVRAQTSQDADWQEYLSKSRPMIEAQESWFLIPAAHSPLQ